VNVTISSAILMIATIIAASIFTAAALQQLYAFQNAFKDVSTRNEEMFSTSITIIGETRGTLPDGPNTIILWVKNTGRTSFSLTGTSWDLFITFPDETYKRFSYNSTTGCSDCWNDKLLNDNGNGVWDPSETIQITVHTASVPAGSYEVRLALPNGVTCEDTFSLG
jgi:archaellum component FlaG (FlaF/FlaG flagellin family)